MKVFTKICIGLVILSCFNCSNDDETIDEEENAEVIIPNAAIVGFDLTTGEFPYVVQWDTAYENAQIDFLPEKLEYQLSPGTLNTIDGNIAIGVGFPIDEIILFDIASDTSVRYSNYFTPENVAVGTYTLNTDNYIVTYYLDEDTCCNIHLHSYNLTTGEDIEFFLGNINIVPLFENTYVQSNKAFASGMDTFSGTERLYIYDLENGVSLGNIDRSAFGGYFYNNEREEVYLFDFTGPSLSYKTLDLTTFSIGESLTFIDGVTAQSNFNEAIFRDNKMIFKQNIGVQGSIPLSAIYDFTTDSLISFENTNLINSIGDATGRVITITDTEVDLENEVYVVSGIYIENGQTKGLVVFMNYNREVLEFAETGDIHPEEIVLY